jgi:hypothetical protein
MGAGCPPGSERKVKAATHIRFTCRSYRGRRRLENETKEDHMRSRFMKLGVTVAALASLAVGGSAIATAAQKGGTPAPPAPTITTPAQAEAPSATDSDNVQQGDQSADTAGTAEAPESATAESATEASDASDGPGGHADPAGNVDTQQQGEN